MVNTSRGDQVTFSENYPQEDIFMQQARKNGEELGISDPSPAVGALIGFMARSVAATSIVEIGTGSGVSGLWAFHGATSDSTLTSIDSEREHLGSAREVFEEAGVRLSEVKYLGSQPWPFPASVMIAFEGVTDAPDAARPDGEEITEVKWFSRSELKAAAEDGSLLLPPAVSVARKMIEHWLGDTQLDRSKLAGETWR